MPLIIGSDGAIQPPGRFGKMYQTQFETGLPAWATLRTGGSYAGSSAPVYAGRCGGVQLSSSAAVSTAVELQGKPIDLEQVAAVRMQIWCTGGSDADTTTWFGFRPAAASNSGLIVRQVATEVDAKFVGYNASGVEKRYLVEYEWSEIPFASNPPPLYDMTLWLLADRSVYFGEGDNIDTTKTYLAADLDLTADVVPVVGASGVATATTGVSLPVHAVSITQFYF